LPPQGHVFAILGVHGLTINIGAEYFRCLAGDEQTLTDFLAMNQKIAGGRVLNDERHAGGQRQKHFQIGDGAASHASEAKQIAFTAEKMQGDVRCQQSVIAIPDDLLRERRVAVNQGASVSK